MDVISWVVALVAGATLISLGRAIALGVGTSVVIRLYQYFLADPRAWGDQFPQDLFGALAMIALTALLAWVGALLGTVLRRRRGIA